MAESTGKRPSQPPEHLTQRRLRASQDRFLKAFRDTGNVTSAAKSTKLPRVKHYEWLKWEVARDKAAEPGSYHERFAEAEVEAIDLLEGEAVRRGKDGWLEPVFQNGKRVGSVRKYCSTLLIFLLKGRKPEMYRERHELTGKNGAVLFPKDCIRIVVGGPEAV